tara:strand:- start:54 stop:605 length:552 start_codon:yes stop_codon:yes gene_type:complete
MDIDDIHNFINNISTSSLNTNLGKLIVLICKKGDIGTQKIISISDRKNDILYGINIIDIKKFKKHKSTIYYYSFFGDIKNILYTLLRDILISMTCDNTKENFYISHTFDRKYPKIEESEIITVDKTNIIDKHNNNSCVVCYENYSKQKVEFKLRCNHSICRECFFNIIIRNDYKCPLCRQIMI